MSIIYGEEAGDLSYLDDKQAGIIGYGNMGRSFALNLRDSGVRVIVSELDDTRKALAESEGFTVAPAAEIVKRASIILLLVPDEIMPQIYIQQVSPYLQRGHTVIFASAYNIKFGFIEAPPFVDIGLVAPRTLGVAVRERYERGEGFFSFVAVGQDATGEAWSAVLAIAKAIGSLSAGGIEVDFEREAELDLFIQQAIMPIFQHMMSNAAQLLIERGYPPAAVFTELYLSGEFRDYLDHVGQTGLSAVSKLASLTSQYGTLSRMERFNDLKFQRLMEITLDEIRSGAFAQEWSKEYQDGYHRLKKLSKAQRSRDFWEQEQQALDMLYPFREVDDDY